MKEKAELVRPKVYPLTKLQTCVKEERLSPDEVCAQLRCVIVAIIFLTALRSLCQEGRTDATEAGHERSEMSASQLLTSSLQGKGESVINTDSLFEQVIRGENSTKRRMHDCLQNEFLYHFVCALGIYEAYESHL